MSASYGAQVETGKPLVFATPVWIKVLQAQKKASQAEA